MRTTSSAAAGIILPSFTEKDLPDQPTFTANRNFTLLVMATDWGFKGNREELCAAAKKEGYDGIEVWWPTEANAQTELFEALDKHGLKVGFLCGGSEPGHLAHLESFKKKY